MSPGRIGGCSSWRFNKDWTRVLVAVLPTQHAPQSSALLNPAWGQGNNKWDLSIKSTAQSGLLGLAVLRTAPHHADMVLWSSKYCASATPQNSHVLLHTGESKAIPGSYFTIPSLFPTSETEGNIYMDVMVYSCLQRQLVHSSSDPCFSFAGQNIKEMCYFSLVQDASLSEEWVFPAAGHTSAQRNAAEREYKCMRQKAAVQDLNGYRSIGNWQKASWSTKPGMGYRQKQQKYFSSAYY